MYNLSIIVAVDEGGGYANGREIPWSYQADWKHFKSVTKGNICVMGRKTYEDIADRRKKRSPNYRVLLPQRESYVISRTLTEAQGATVRTGVSHVLDGLQNDQRDVFLLGGYHLWVQHWNSVKQIWVTIVPGYHGCNKRFPVEWLDKDYEIVDGRQEGDLKFVKYVRKVVYYTAMIRTPDLRKHVRDRFKMTHRFVKDDPYNSTVTFIEPRPEEIAAIERFGTITKRNGLVTENENQTIIGKHKDEKA